MRVLLVTEQYPPVQGGVGVSTERIARNLARRGVEVSVFTFEGDRPLGSLPYTRTETDAAHGFGVVRAGPFACGANADADEKQKAVARRNVSHLLTRHIRQVAPDVVHSMYVYNAGFLATFGAKACGVPHVVSVRGNDVGRNVFNEARFGIVRWTLEEADRLTFVNRHLLRVACQAFPVAGKSVVISNSVQPTPSACDRPEGRAELRARYGIPEGLAVVAFVGTAREKKGIYLLARALGELDAAVPFHLLLIGDFRSQAERERFRALAAESRLSGRVTVTGFVPHGAIPGLLAGVDLVVMPSLDDGLPNALLESMECGKPVLASSIFEEVIEHGANGFLFRSHDHAHLREQIELLLAGRDGLRAVGEEARRTVRLRFTPERETDAYLRCYEELLGPAASASADGPERIPVFRPSGSALEKERVARVLDSGWWGYGSEARALEASARLLFEAREALACSSATAALHLALLLAGVGPGDEVILPPLTFASTAMAVRYAGATPVFADVDPVFLHLDPRSVEARASERTKAVIVVHYTGVPGPLDELHALLSGRAIPLIEDAAHAAGAVYRGRPIGGHSPFVCFSLNAVKNAAAGEGGLLCFSAPGLRPTAERLSWLGLSRQTFELSHDVPHRSPPAVTGLGFKYRMSDLTASIALAQLERLAATNQRRRLLAEAYRERLGGSAAVQLPSVRPGAEASWHMFVVRVPAEARDALREALGAAGIETSIHYRPLNEEPFFADSGGETPVASAEARRLVTLPLFPDLSLAQVDFICDRVRTFFGS